MTTSPDGIMIPIIFKGSLPYIKYYYPTDKQMRDITHKEITTSPEEWNPSLLDNSPNASEQRLRQFPPTPINTIDDLYNMEGNIVVQKNDINDRSIVSDASSTSSGSRQRMYQARTRKDN